MPDKIKILYDAVSKDYNVGSFEDFQTKLQDDVKRKVFYDGVSSEFELGDFNTFSSKVKKKDIAQPDFQFGSQTSPFGSKPYQTQVDTSVPSVLLTDDQKKQADKERIGKRFETTLLDVPTEFGKVAPAMKAAKKVKDTLPDTPEFRRVGEIQKNKPVEMTEGQRLGESLTKGSDFQEITTDRLTNKKTALQKQLEQAKGAFASVQGEDVAREIDMYIQDPESFRDIETNTWLGNAIRTGLLTGDLANAIPTADYNPSQEAIARAADANYKMGRIPQSEAQIEFQKSGFGVFKDPLLGAQWLTETAASSLAGLYQAAKRTVPLSVGAGATAGAAFFGVGAIPGALLGLQSGLGVAGLNLATSSNIIESLNENGVDITNRKELIKAFSDEEKMSEIRSTALKYGVPIMVLDLATAGIAGKLIGGAAGKSIARKIGAGLGEAGIQATGGMIGELSGQALSGQEIDWNEVAAEGVVSLFTDAPDVAIGAMTRDKSSSSNKNIVAQINKFGADDGSVDAKINLDRDLANGTITPEEYEQGVQFIGKAVVANEKIPIGIEGENREKSIELIAKKDDILLDIEKLNKQKEDVDDSFYPAIDEQIKAKESEIKILNKDIQESAKTPTKPITAQPTQELPIVEPLKDVESTAKALDLKDESIENLDVVYNELSSSKNKEVRALANMVENIQEKNERNSVLNNSLENVNKTIDEILKQDSYFLEKREAREAKEVANKYLGEVSKQEAKKDFKDAFFGNPNTWVADALKMREAVRVYIENAGTFKELLSSVQKEFESDGFTEQDAANVIKNKLDSLVKKDFRQQQISEAYHKAKIDGSNPELVEAVEKLLKPKTDAIQEQTIGQDLSKQEDIIKDVLELSDDDATVLSYIYNSNLTPDEKKILFRQWKRGVMSVGEIKRMTVIDLEKLKNEDIDRWAKAILIKNKGKKVVAEDIDFEDIPTKKEKDAVQIETAGQVPVLTEAPTGKKVEQGKPESKVEGVTEEGKEVIIDKESIVKNSAKELERVKSANKESEDGATFNIDGTKYEGVGLVVPVTSLNTTINKINPQMLADFVEKNKNKIGDMDTVKFGIYKFPNSNQISIDLNIIASEKFKDQAIEFGRLAGQESLFDLETYENVKTGSDGKNPIDFTDTQFKEISKALKDGRIPDVFVKEEVDTKQQIENFGVAKNQVESVNNVISKVFDGLKKAGLTTAKNVGEWIGISKGVKSKEALKLEYGRFQKLGFEETDEYKKLKNNGYIIENFDIRSIGEKPIVIINPDNMITGKILSKEGKPILDANGGIHFVSKFGDVWASSDKATANTLAKYINTARENDIKNGGNGIVHIVVTKGSLGKSLTSHTGAKGSMAIIEYLVDKGMIPLKDFRNALIFAGKIQGIDFNGKLDSKSIHEDIAKKFFGVNDSSFQGRGFFIRDVINHIAKNSKSVHNNIVEIRDALNSKEVGRKITFGEAGIRDAIGNLFADQMTQGVPNSHAYATIEISKPVEVVKGEHESYPFHIKQIDGERPKLNILSETSHIKDIATPREGSTNLGSNQIGMAEASIKSVKDIDSLKQGINAQYRIESGKNIIEAIQDFNGSKKAVVAITHEVMHPTVVAIINGAKDGNEIGAKHTETIVSEFNKTNPSNKVTVEQLIEWNDLFKSGKTDKRYRSVQEFIAKSWEKYHKEGGKGFSAQFQEVLNQITEAFKSVYKSISGKKLTPELRKMFDEILGKDITKEPELNESNVENAIELLDEIEDNKRKAERASSKRKAELDEKITEAQTELDKISEEAQIVKTINDNFDKIKKDLKEQGLLNVKC